MTVELSSRGRELLTELLTRSLAGRGRVDERRFKMDFDRDWDAIGDLAARQFIERAHGQWLVLKLRGIAELAGSDARAARLWDSCSRLFECLRREAKAEPGVKLMVTDLPAKASVSEQEVREALPVLFTIAIVGGSLDLDAPEAHVVPADTIVRYQKLEDLVEEAKQWERNSAKKRRWRRELASWPWPVPQVHAARRMTRAEVPSPPPWIRQAPAPLQELFIEVYGALANDFRACAAMGIRAIVDMLATEQLGDVGGFDRKLPLLVERKLVTPKEGKVLAHVVDVGHAASHRGFRPKIRDLRSMLECVEKVAFSLYVAEAVSSRASEAAPKRVRAKRSG